MNLESTNGQGGNAARRASWVGVGLGVAQLAAPRLVRRVANGGPVTPTSRALRSAREAVHIAALAGNLVSRKNAPQIAWMKLAGDVFDLALITRALRSERAEDRPGRALAISAAVAVAGITARDLYAAIRATRATGASQEAGGIHLDAAITINCSPETAYEFWRDFENLPAFMTHLESVTVTGPTSSRWTAKAPTGSVRWDAELTADKPNELIGWRSRPGASVPNAGSVRFRPAPGDRGTEVRVELAYNPPAGKLGAVVASLLGENPDQQVRDDLRRFKQVLETGEVVRSEGSPEGTQALRQATSRPARPGQLAPVIGGGTP